MIIERGPHGQIQVFDINKNDELILHALDVLQNQLCPLFPKIYIREQLDQKQLCLDCTGLINISDFAPSEILWTRRHVRQSIKDLLLHLLNALDYCLPLSCCDVSMKGIWVNPETGKIFFSYLPLITDLHIFDCRLSSLNLHDFESFLLLPNISKHIDEVTRDSIIHALENDDENFLRQVAEELLNEEHQVNKGKEISTFLLISLPVLLTTIILSSSLLFIKNESGATISSPKIGATLLFVSVLLTISVLIFEMKKKSPCSNHQNTHKHEAHLLFSPFSSPLLSYAQNQFEQKLFPAFLTEQSEYGARPENKRIKRALWTSDYLIGSNKYTCDLYLEDACIDEMHARIIRKENLFYLIDLGSNEGTWISHRKLFSHEETLLCNNDLIRIGNRYFLFTFQLENNTELRHQILESAGTSNEGATSPPVR